MSELALENILLAREARWQRRLEEAPRWPSLLSVTLCIPLPGRSDPRFSAWFSRSCAVILQQLEQEGHSPVCLEWESTSDGPVMLVGCGKSADALKHLCVSLEEMLPGGRMLDLDVMGPDLHAWSRSDLALPPRRCFLCERDAAVCVVERAHSRDNLLDFALKRINETQ